MNNRKRGEKATGEGPSLRRYNKGKGLFTPNEDHFDEEKATEAKREERGRSPAI